MAGYGDIFDPTWGQVRQAQSSAFAHAAQSQKNLEHSFTYLALRTLAEIELEKVFPQHPLIGNLLMVEKFKEQATRVCVLSDPVDSDDARAFAANYPLDNGITSPRGIMAMKKYLANIGEIELTAGDHEKIKAMGLNEQVASRAELQRAARELAERREKSAAIRVMQEAHPEVAQAMIAALPPAPPPPPPGTGFFASLFSPPVPPPSTPVPVFPPSVKVQGTWHNGRWIERALHEGEWLEVDNWLEMNAEHPEDRDSEKAEPQNLGAEPEREIEIRARATAFMELAAQAIAVDEAAKLAASIPPAPPAAPVIPPGAKIHRTWHNGQWVEKIIEAAPLAEPARRGTLAQTVGSAGAARTSMPAPNPRGS